MFPLLTMLDMKNKLEVNKRQNERFLCGCLFSDKSGQLLQYGPLLISWGEGCVRFERAEQGLFEEEFFFSQE